MSPLSLVAGPIHQSISDHESGAEDGSSLSFKLGLGNSFCSSEVTSGNCQTALQKQLSSRSNQKLEQARPSG